MNINVSTLRLPSTWGTVEVMTEAGKVIACDLPMLEQQPSVPLRWKSSTVDHPLNENTSVLRAAESFVKGMFDGHAVATPPIQLPEGPAFHRRVWRALIRVPFGKTVTYGTLALAVDSPKAARAVGQACGANQIPLFIPCHRVCASHGGLGGFSCGLPWKIALLEAESG